MNHKCFKCDKEIEFEPRPFDSENDDLYPVVPSRKVPLTKPIAIAKSEDKVLYEVEVKCSECGTVNKATFSE